MTARDIELVTYFICDVVIFPSEFLEANLAKFIRTVCTVSSIKRFNRIFNRLSLAST